MLERKLIGKSFPAVLNEVEKGAIRRYAAAVGDENPLYQDEEAARAAGFRDLVAPPTFASTFSGGVDLLEMLDIASRNVLVGEQSFEFHRDICAGDRILVSSRVVDVYEKIGAGGTMDFAVLEDEGRDERGALIYRARRTLIARPPLPQAPAAGAPTATP